MIDLHLLFSKQHCHMCHLNTVTRAICIYSGRKRAWFLLPTVNANFTELNWIKGKPPWQLTGQKSLQLTHAAGWCSTWSVTAVTSTQLSTFRRQLNVFYIPAIIIYWHHAISGPCSDCATQTTLIFFLTNWLKIPPKRGRRTAIKTA